MTENEHMKSKLKEYLNTVLADAPVSQRAEELRTELYQNMCDKYDDLIGEGRTPAAAYNAAIAGLGDISPLLEELSNCPAANTTLVGDTEMADNGRNRATEEQQEAFRRYRRRSAILIPVAVILYILSALPVILLERYNENVGIVCMLSMIAVATGILIFNNLSKPIASPVPRAGVSPAASAGADSPSAQEGFETSPRGKVYKAISGALWILTVLVYLGVSFLTMRWALTWMIFLIAAAVDNIMKAIFDLTE